MTKKWRGKECNTEKSCSKKTNKKTGPLARVSEYGV